MNDTLLYLSRHNMWATRTLLRVCRPLSTEQLNAPGGAAFGTILQTLNHLVVADGGYLWSLGGPQTPWVALREDLRRRSDDRDAELEDAGLDELARRVEETERLWESFFASKEFEPDRGVTLDEGTYECPAWIVMAQLFNHGSIHREQVCAMLTGLSIEPPDLQPWAFADATGLSRFLGGRTS
jgi:uncharacterized damage-inducible protein DinB